MRTNLMVANLTGREIVIVDRYVNIIKTFPPCLTEEPMRAEVTLRRQKRIDGVKLSKLYYKINMTDDEINELIRKYDGIIVSKITAECLKELGYTEGIYITGRKFYKYGEFLGVKELCIL